MINNINHIDSLYRQPGQAPSTSRGLAQSKPANETTISTSQLSKIAIGQQIDLSV